MSREFRDHPRDDLPKAKVGKDWKTWLFWIVPIGAALLAGYFIYQNAHKGPKLHIYFSDASGLQQGKSSMQYRGATIGQVEKVQLTPDHKQVDVTVALEKSASSVAREGSRFWIVKAQLGAAQIRDIMTIVSGDYITVEPGEGKEQTTFQGLAQVPVVMPPAMVRFVLIAERLGWLKPRAPVFYRGIQVGEVASCELAPESQTVQLSIDIARHYAPLVRANSVFWNAGGVNVNLSLSGAEISAQSTKALIAGGIDFATPDTSLKPAPPGTTFRLYENPQNPWLKWAPAIHLDPNEPTTLPSGWQNFGGPL